MNLLWPMVGMVFLMAGGMELALHWFPWRVLLGRMLRRTEAYVLGTLGMLGPFVLGLLAGEAEVLTGQVLILLGAAVAGAGGATLVAYWADGVMGRFREGRDALKREGVWEDAIEQTIDEAARHGGDAVGASDGDGDEYEDDRAAERAGVGQA